MHHALSTATSEQSAIEAPTSSLHPVLRTALDSLDVELEEELTRYRRQKYRQTRQMGYQRVEQPRSGHRSPAAAGLQLPQLGSASGSPLDLSGLSPEMSRAVTQAIARAQQPTAQSAQDSSPTSVSQASPSTAAATPRANRPAPAAPVSRSPHPLSAPAMPAAPVMPMESPWVEESVDPEAGAIDAYTPPSPEPEVPNSPEDYLESTEELLRSIAEESATLRREREPGLLDSLLTPLGVGSMLLLLLSSLSLGYVIMYPSSLDRLTGDDRAARPAEDETATGRSSEEFASPMIPDSPNLAAEEFVDLNIDSLTTLPREERRSSSSPSPAPGAAPGSANTSPLLGSAPTGTSSADPATSAPDALSSASTAPEESSSAWAPEPETSADNAAPIASAPELPVYVPEVAPAPPAPIDEPPPAAPSAPSAPIATAPSSSPSSYYYVVTPYQGDASLEQARESVPDAFVRNSDAGANVQLGVYSDETKAREAQQQLQQQGISAEIVQP